MTSKIQYKILAVSKQSLGILTGSLIYGISLSWFLLPYKIAPGGVGGLSQVFYHFLGWNAGISMIFMNIPLWIIGITVIGKQFGAGTFLGFFISSIMTDIVSPARLYKWGFFKDVIERYNFQNGEWLPQAQWAMTDNIFLAAIAGSMLLGVGLGIIFKNRASTGGTDIPVAIMKQKLGISVGNGYLLIDTFIIIGIGLIFQDLNLIIWGCFGLYLSSKFADVMTEGLSRVKAAMIICSSHEFAKSISIQISEKMDRGCTYLKAAGAYMEDEKTVIYVTYNIRQTAILKQIVNQNDPHAFMVLHDVHDVIGSGFRSRSIDLA